MRDNQLDVVDTRALPTSLEILDLSENTISDVTYGFSRFSQLQILSLQHNQLRAVPSDFSSPSDNPSLVDM